MVLEVPSPQEKTEQSNVKFRALCSDAYHTYIVRFAPTPSEPRSIMRGRPAAFCLGNSPQAKEIITLIRQMGSALSYAVIEALYDEEKCKTIINEWCWS